jgi:predicted DNA-binding transcriptional regulator AlpA
MTDIAFEPLLTVEDLEQILKVNRRTVMRLCKKGLLPEPMKLGGGNRWRKEDVAEALDVLNSKRRKTAEGNELAA